VTSAGLGWKQYGAGWEGRAGQDGCGLEVCGVEGAKISQIPGGVRRVLNSRGGSGQKISTRAGL